MTHRVVNRRVSRAQASQLISATRHKKWWIIPATLAVAIVLSAIPVGSHWQTYRPDWVSLVIIYWCFAVPGKIGLGSAWLIGILLDVLSFGVLGRYALSKVLIVFIADRLSLRVRTFPIWQQAWLILLLLLAETLMVTLSEVFVGRMHFTYDRVIASIIGALLWIPIYFVLRRLRHWARLP